MIFSLVNIQSFNTIMSEDLFFRLFLVSPLSGMKKINSGFCYVKKYNDFNTTCTSKVIDSTLSVQYTEKVSYD